MNKEEKPEQPQEQPQEEAQKEEAPKVTVKDIIDSYPLDRTRAHDYILLSIDNSLGKIANTLEWFAKRKQEKIDKEIQLKD